LSLFWQSLEKHAGCDPTVRQFVTEPNGDKFFVSQWFVDDIPVRGRPEVHRAFVTWFTEARNSRNPIELFQPQRQ